MALDGNDGQLSNISESDGGEGKNDNHDAISKGEAAAGKDSTSSGGEAVVASKEGLPTVQMDWEKDSKNPFNWPMKKRIYHTVLTGMFGLVV